MFKSIGNFLGTYLETDMSFTQNQNKAMAWILVSLNPRGGLAESIKIQYKYYVFEQPLDYEHLPFKCHRCHAYGHLARDCPIGKRRRRNPKTVKQKGEEVEPEKNRGTEEVQEIVSMEVDINQEGRTMGQATKESNDSENAVGNPLGKGNLVQESIKEPTAANKGELKGMQLDSSTPSLSHSEMKDACLTSGSHINNCIFDEHPCR